ncbi:MAG: ABC transporter permease [Pseudomonadota bacterium]
MTWLRLAFANLCLSPLSSAVNVLLMTLGTASIVLLLLAGSQLTERMARDARGIDLVLGAKGSPIQLVLSAVYHADTPTGNIPLQAAQRWAADPRIARAVPLSLGDSYREFRIVGTTTDILEIYDATLIEGRPWKKSMEAVVGAATAEAQSLGLGARFASSHGLADGGPVHDYRPYEVVGVLAPTGTVIDRLVLTSLDSVWDLHDVDHVGQSRHGGLITLSNSGRPAVQDAQTTSANTSPSTPSVGLPEEHARDRNDITAMLLSYRSPIAAISLPRLINADPALQAAAPAIEVSRVLQLIGIGLDGLEAFAWVLIVTAGLSVFAALYGSLHARQRDLATLRCLGATRGELMLSMLLEGLLLSVVGVTLGFLLGHVTMELLGGWLQSARGIELTGWRWLPAETGLLLGLFAVGAVAAAIPAVQAYRNDPARTLAQS